jgi:vitamin B12 transporter
VSLRYRKRHFSAAISGYRQKLHDEIVTVSVPGTFLQTAINRTATSRRSGVEAEIAWSPSEAFRLSANYAYLDATEPTGIEATQLREVRRPKHSGSVAIDGRSGQFTYGGSIAYVGERGDTNFDVFPSQPVRLHAYWLAGGRLALTVRPGIELFTRASNLFDSKYQDVFGYRTEGRALYAGIRIGGS